jgi:hypothetical protein
VFDRSDDFCGCVLARSAASERPMPTGPHQSTSNPARNLPVQGVGQCSTTSGPTAGDGIREFPPYTIAGQFIASVGTDKNGSPKGILSITATSNVQGTGSSRQEVAVGSYTIFPDCSGGTLTFNLSTQPVSWDFWIDGSFAIHGVSITPEVIAVINPTCTGCACCIAAHLLANNTYCSAVAGCKAGGVCPMNASFPPCS